MNPKNTQKQFDQNKYMSMDLTETSSVQSIDSAIVDDESGTASMQDWAYLFLEREKREKQNEK